MDGLRRWVDRQVWGLRDGGLLGWLPVLLLVGAEAIVGIAIITGSLPSLAGILLLLVSLGLFLLAQPFTRTARTVALVVGAGLLIGAASQVHGPMRTGLAVLAIASVMAGFLWQERLLSALPAGDRSYHEQLSRIRTESKRARQAGSTRDAIAAANLTAISQLETLEPPAAEWVPVRELAIDYYRSRLDLLEGRIPPDENAAPMLEAAWDRVRTAWASALRVRSHRW